MARAAGLVARGHPVEHRPLFTPLGIGDHELEHEAVDLRLGQRIRPLVLDRILRGQDQEQLGQREGAPADGHLLLLHRFQQRALHLRGRAIDLVGEQEVGEDRPLLHRELAGPLVVDHRADEIGGQQVRGELDPMEPRGDGRGEGSDRERLGETGDALQKHVAVGEEADQQAFQHRPLAHDHPAELFHQLGGDPGLGLDLGGGERLGGRAVGERCHWGNVAKDRRAGGQAVRDRRFYFIPSEARDLVSQLRTRPGKIPRSARDEVSVIARPRLPACLY